LRNEKTFEEHFEGLSRGHFEIFEVQKDFFAGNLQNHTLGGIIRRFSAFFDALGKFKRFDG